MVNKYIIIVYICLGVATAVYSQNRCDSIHFLLGTPEQLPKGDVLNIINENLKYPTTALQEKTEGNVTIRFWIDSLGHTSEHQIIKGVRKDLDSEALRVAKFIKFDEPAFNNNKPIGMCYQMDILFRLPKNDLIPDSSNSFIIHSKSVPYCETAKKDSIEIIFAVEAWPDFNKESTKGLIKFIDKNVREVKVPESRTRVVVQFLVDTLGYTSNHKIIRGVNPELDNEALRVSRLLKFMKPAIQHGKPVNFNYTLVFDFEKYSFDKTK